MVSPSRTPEARRDYYLAHKEQAHKKTRESKRRIREDTRLALALLKLKWGCCECGYNAHPSGLAFHHTGGDKEIDIARAVWDGWGWERLKTELRKCDVICHNCHAIHHFGEVEAALVAAATGAALWV